MNTTVRINTANPYDVTIGSNLLTTCGALLRQAGLEGRVVVVSDTNVAPLYLEKVLTSMKYAGYECRSFVFTAGEEFKTLDTLGNILDSFADFSLTRGDFAVALGGGVTGDMTGFAAGCYMRGISYVQLPTTLLAAVDSSVGGKTAIDLKSGKNLAGLFIQPRAVLCDTNTLLTLPHNIFCDGAAEAVKTGIIGDAELFDIFHDTSWKERADEIISRSVAVKGRIVALDERESDLRKLLNLGHTPAHAIEVLSGYKISHGSAVAAGTAIMARAAARLGIAPKDEAERIVDVIGKISLHDNTSYSARQLADAALNDKKRSGDSIDLIFPEKVGSCRIVKTNLSELEDIFKAGMEAI